MASMLLSCQRYLTSIKKSTKTGRMIGTQSKGFVTDILEKMHSESLPRACPKSGKMRRKSTIDIFEQMFYSVIKYKRPGG